jgi:hypothetical protein
MATGNIRTEIEKKYAKKVGANFLGIDEAGCDKSIRQTHR